MEKLDDEHMQQIIEDGFNLSGFNYSKAENEELKSYQNLFIVLNSAPNLMIPEDFASKVTDTVRVKAYRKSEIRFAFISVLIFAVGLTGVDALLNLINSEISRQFFIVNFRFKWIILYGLVIFFCIFYFNRKIVKEIHY